MSKKKKKKKKKHDYDSYVLNLKRLDKNLSSSYEDLCDEIRCMHYKLEKADKKKKRDKDGFYMSRKESIKIRKKMLKEWEQTSFLERVAEAITQAGPIIKIIGRLIAALIILFLSIDSVKQSIKPKTMKKITDIFDIAITI